MTEIGNEHYSVTVKLAMHITQLKSWKDSAQQPRLSAKAHIQSNPLM